LPFRHFGLLTGREALFVGVHGDVEGADEAVKALAVAALEGLRGGVVDLRSAVSCLLSAVSCWLSAIVARFVGP
jgi:hypothetical protein